MSYVLTADALQDFNSIYEYSLELFGYPQAKKYKDTIEKATAELAKSPYAYRCVSEVHAQIRAISAGKHIIFGMVNRQTHADYWNFPPTHRHHTSPTTPSLRAL